MSLYIENEAEAEAMNDVLHCGHVTVGDGWDTETAWADDTLRELARLVLLNYREAGRLPDEGIRRRLAVCCAE